MKRAVFRVQYRPNLGWCVMFERTIDSSFGLQCRAIRHAVFWARQAWKVRGQVAQVVLHGRDGRIRWERTYGADPKRRPG